MGRRLLTYIHIKNHIALMSTLAFCVPFDPCKHVSRLMEINRKTLAII